MGRHVALALSTGAWAQNIANPAENAFLENGLVRIGEIRRISRNSVGAASFIFPSGDRLVNGLETVRRLHLAGIGRDSL